jgi:hypothetical protein
MAEISIEKHVEGEREKGRKGSGDSSTENSRMKASALHLQ